MTAEAFAFLVAIAVPLATLIALVGLIAGIRGLGRSRDERVAEVQMFWTKDDDRSFVDGARVGCPLRGADVDIEECMARSKLLRVVEDDPPYVVCTAWRESARTTEIVF